MNEQLKREELRKMIEVNTESVIGMKCRGFRFDIPQEWDDGRMGKLEGKEGVIWMLSYQSFILIKFEDEFYPYPINEIHNHIVLEEEVKPTFIPTSMPCTQEQFESIKQRLLDGGCEIERISGFDYFAILVNNLSGIEKMVSNIRNRDKKEYNRTYYPKFNPEIFLRNCGIETNVEPKVFTCKDLSEGRVVCKNDAKLKELEKVIKYCYPEDNGVPNGQFDYWGRDEVSHTLWKVYDLEEIQEKNIPTQSVKVFLKEIEDNEKPKVIKVGDYVRGFKFRSQEGYVSPDMEQYIGQIGEAIEVDKDGNNVDIRFSNGESYLYPLDQAIKHLANEDMEEFESALISNTDESYTQDNINPSHYKRLPKETIERIQDNLTPEEFKGYLKGNIFKYIDRYENKNGVECLKKAQWYLEKLIDLKY